MSAADAAKVLIASAVVAARSVLKQFVIDIPSVTGGSAHLLKETDATFSLLPKQRMSLFATFG
jgi:hypothetical protein